MSLAPVFATAFGRGYQLASLPQYYTYAGVHVFCFRFKFKRVDYY